MERKIFTQLDPLSGPYLNNYLTHAGFRRSQNVIYRPACEACRECKSLRILANDFEPSKSLRRTMARNSDLTRHVAEPLATSEQFDLLQRYLQSRHEGGGMSDMDFYRYEMMVEQCASETEIVEYRDADNKLIAAVLIDVLEDGLSMVYSYFDPDARGRSLGNYMILDHLDRCQMEKLPHLYLGYWVDGSPKMSYKARFQPCEILGPHGWRPLHDKP
jgi:arginine-tRNA-protein transferase